VRTIFKQLQFTAEHDYRDTIHKSEFEFFVPGVNSGIYAPATLHIRVLATEKRARMLGFKTVKTFSEITLTTSQFDELFSQMVKIKNLRDLKI
jgi:hypothetical protein